jgi:multisubunit Na+/H+ antiporter MnhB subunit
MTDDFNEQENVGIHKVKMDKLRGVQWLRSYRNWAVLMVSIVALVGIATYLLTGNLTWHPHGHWRWEKETNDRYGTDLPPVTKDP